MSYDVDCPFCETEIEVTKWENGECPNCKESYWWEEYCTTDYSDCWSCVEWDYKKTEK